jgi:DNA-binding response OmpR family regulator/DNA-binding CsgD family transcriptional regulator
MINIPNNYLSIIIILMINKIFNRSITFLVDLHLFLSIIYIVSLFMNEYLILIVDDDPKQLKILTGNLIEYLPGLKLLIATNGKSGIDIAIRNMPDLILMDWEMPVMNGIDAIKLLKATEETKSIPVIMVTGTHGETAKLKEALDAGAIDFVNKPFNAIELIARINTQIRHVDTFRKLIEQQEIINQQEKAISAKERMLLELDIDHHQKQLTMQTVNLIRNSELLQSVLSDLRTISPFTTSEGQSIINSLEFRINDKTNDHILKEFEFCFEMVYQDFYKKLNLGLPDLSVREQRLCAFLKMNMSTKEIAAITFQTPNSIDVAKYRLRKKSGVENDEDFTKFLINL